MMAIHSRFQSAASRRGYDRPYLQNPTGRTETPQSNGRHSDRKRLLDKRPAGIILPAICGTVRNNRRPSDTNIPPALYISNQKIKKDMKGTVLFITGIDTNIGKTFATGMIACALAEKGKKVITQKMIQTGCTEVSEDTEMHRKIQGSLSPKRIKPD